MDCEDDEYEKLAYQQRLKAAVHFTVGQICECLGQKENVTFTRKYIAALSEVTFHQAQMLSKDAEMFAQHAKRQVINCEDIKLLVRRNSSLVEHLKKTQDLLNVANEAEKERRKKNKQSKKADENQNKDNS